MQKIKWLYAATVLAAFAAAPPCRCAEAAAASALDDSTFLDLLQRSAINFFWQEANSSTGLIRDSSAPHVPSSTASVGFGITALCIGIDRGWLPRENVRQRILTTYRTLWKTPQGREAQGRCGYKGLYYHFLNMSTATREWNSELSDIDTALLFAGILYGKEYFDGEHPDEVEIRALADSIYYRADWEWMRNYQPGLTLEWTPERGFANGWWAGYNEMMIMYILGLGSPTHPLPEITWKNWCSGYVWKAQYGYEYVNFAPLFGHQFSHCWIDFRGIQDDYMRKKGIDYFENSRRATYAAQAYCIDNPKKWKGYGEFVWGITPSDGPNGYAARGAPPAENEDGTISPTAVGASIAFAPEICLPTLKYWYDTYRSLLWGAYGFRDAFNLQKNWWSSFVIGIDQGPIVIMIENYRSGKVWRTFMKNTDVRRGLHRAGFRATGTGVKTGSTSQPDAVLLLRSYPNPCNDTTALEYVLPHAGSIRLMLYDVSGRTVRTLFSGWKEAGQHRELLSSGRLASGLYFCRLEAEGQSVTHKLQVLK